MKLKQIYSFSKRFLWNNGYLERGIFDHRWTVLDECDLGHRAGVTPYGAMLLCGASYMYGKHGPQREEEILFLRYPALIPQRARDALSETWAIFSRPLRGLLSRHSAFCC